MNPFPVACLISKDCTGKFTYFQCARIHSSERVKFFTQVVVKTGNEIDRSIPTTLRHVQVVSPNLVISQVSPQMQSNVNGPCSIPPRALQSTAIPTRIPRPVSRLRARSNEKQSQLPQMSEEEMFLDVLNRARNLFDEVQDVPGSEVFIRAAQVLYERRTLGIATALIEGSDEQGTLHPIVTLLWQTAEHPPRAVCINFRRTTVRARGSNSQRDGSFVSVTCSCDPTISWSGDGDDACIHITTCLLQSEVRDAAFTCILDYNISARPCFGEPLKSTGDLRTINLESNSERNTSFSSRIRRKWSFWMSLDARAMLFVPVLKVTGSFFQCLMCRGNCNTRGKCNHEVSCARSMRSTSQNNRELPGDTEIDVIRDEEPTVIHDYDSDTDVESGSEGEETKTEKESNSYCPLHLTRPLMMCKSEERKLAEIIEMLETCRKDTDITLKDIDATCPHCLTERTRECTFTVTREVWFFTLLHGVPKVIVEDWRCPNKSCARMVFFTGENLPVFPTRRQFLFSTELLYHWVRSVGRQGISFRAAYDLYRNVGTSHSVRWRFMNESGGGELRDNMKQLSRLQRRRSNEAFQLFIKTLDVGSFSVTKQLFSCDTCEEPLSEEDCAVLRIPKEKASQLKRFRGVVVDGTNAGILHKLPAYERQEVLLRAKQKQRLKQKMLPRRKHQKALVKFVGLGTATLRKRFQHTGEEQPVLLFPLRSTTRRKRGSKNPKLDKSEVDDLRMLSGDNVCFCDHPTTHYHSRACRKKLRLFSSSVECECARNFFQLVCDVEQRVGPIEDDYQKVADEDDDEEQVESSGEDSDGELREQAQVRNSTQEGNDQAVDSDDNDDESPEPVPRQQMSWFGVLRFPSIRQPGQLIESFLELVVMLCTAHVAVPYLLPLRPDYNVDNDWDDENRYAVTRLAKQGIALHHELIASLREVNQCPHVQHDPPCSECFISLQTCARRVRPINPILFRFVIELINHEHHLGAFKSQLIAACADALEEHIRYAVIYLTNYDTAFQQDCKNFWDKYGSVNVEELPNQDEHGLRSGVSFPGRRGYRPLIKFDRKETHQCTKKYTDSQSHTHGLLIVMCVCAHPKLIGYIVMTRSESTALALSSVIMHFPVPPRTIYYDNGCNMAASVLLRMPWLLVMSFITVDRFHYKGHLCNARFDATRFPQLDDHRTSAAESINSNIKRALFHIRYLRGENLVTYLNVFFALLNLQTILSLTCGRRDIEDENLQGFFASLQCCPCRGCRVNEDGGN